MGQSLLLKRRKECNRVKKRARVNLSELLHDAFLVNAARSKEKQWHGLKGHEKLLFLEAVSKQWNAWQENAAATLIFPAEGRVSGRGPRLVLLATEEWSPSPRS